MTDNYYILTGAMGAGKSTVLKQLRKLQYTCIDEPAREIIAEQRAIDGDGIYDRDPKLFYNLMLSRAVYQYKQNQSNSKSIIWDRGIADNIAYAKLFKLETKAAEKAAKLYRYNNKVFFLSAWESIYVNDEERKMSFVDAKAFGDMLKGIYINNGYKIIEVPQVSPEQRANFIVENI